MSASSETIQVASTLVRILWNKLELPSSEVDPRSVAVLYAEAAAALSTCTDRFRAAFVAKSRRKSPVLFDAPVSEWEANFNDYLAGRGFGPLSRPHLQALCWHELALAVARFCFPGRLAGEDWLEAAWKAVCSPDGFDLEDYHLFAAIPKPEELPDWRKQLAAIVAKFPRALHNIEAELRAATAKPRGSVADALGYLTKNPNATDVEAAEAAGVTTRALRASPRWRMVRDRQREQARLEAQDRYPNAEKSAASAGLRIRKNRRK